MAGRKPNALDSVPITIATNPVIKQYLDDLALTGLYGKSATEVAERLIAQRIAHLIETAQLKKRSV
jgi:hypothetical protein